MRITFVLPEFSALPVGGYRVVYEYANRLTFRGHHVSVVHARGFIVSRPKNPYRWLRRIGRRFLDMFFPPDVDWQPIDRRVRMLYVPDPRPRYVPDADAVFATAWQTAEYVAEYPASKGRKFYLIMDFGAFFGPRDRLEATWRQPFQKVTISGWLYEQVCSAPGGRCNTVNIPIGIDHQRFRATADIGRRSKRATMFYGYSSYKAPEDAVSALEIAKQRHPDMGVAVFGQRDQKPRNLPSWASYQGNVSEKNLIDIYNNSSIFVCSSLAEGFALPPAEAMACGCAVASTDCGGIREFAEHEVTALLSPPRDPEALARNITRLLDDDGLRQRLASAGHERIQSFTWERSTDQLEQFIRLHVANGAEK
jgi:glycosyltransferase involved in cell wall biosynthesis